MTFHMHEYFSSEDLDFRNLAKFSLKFYNFSRNLQSFQPIRLGPWNFCNQAIGSLAGLKQGRGSGGVGRPIPAAWLAGGEG